MLVVRLFISSCYVRDSFSVTMKHSCLLYGNHKNGINSLDICVIRIFRGNYQFYFSEYTLKYCFNKCQIGRLFLDTYVMFMLLEMLMHSTANCDVNIAVKNQNGKMINRKFIATQLHTAAFFLIAFRIVQFGWKIVCLKKKPDLFSPRPNVAYE